MTKVLRADDKRRNYHKAEVGETSTGEAKRVSAVFHDRRHSSGKNGKGKRAR